MAVDYLSAINSSGSGLNISQIVTSLVEAETAPEQDSIKNTENKFNESNNKNDISKKDMNELVSDKSEEVPIELALEKPKPKMMVFKPKNNEKKT